jgi:hypothetical protein
MKVGNKCGKDKRREEKRKEKKKRKECEGSGRKGAKQKSDDN